MQAIDKRIIIREGVPPQLAASAALQFYQDYVVNGQIKFGEYHHRSYTGQIIGGDRGKGEEVTINVWHTKASIVAALAPSGSEEPEESTD